MIVDPKSRSLSFRLEKGLQVFSRNFLKNFAKKKGTNQSIMRICLNKSSKNNFHQIENYGFWIFLTPAPLYKLDAGWTSSFSHGLLLNVFFKPLRVYILRVFNLSLNMFQTKLFI